MADLFQFICENSDHSQILPVLKRFVERKDFVVDTNFLESLKLVLNALEKSKNFGEDLAATVLFEICWPMVYSSSLAKDNNQLSGHNRKRLHLCYEIIAFCCSVFPKTLLSEVCEKSLHILRRYVVEMSATEDNAKDVSITLDLVGYLVKPHALSPSERNNTISGELGDMLFQELLNILPFTTESLCGKATGLVLPNFLEFKRVERCEAVWSVVKQIFESQAAGSSSGTFNQTYAILCGLADFFSSPDNYSLFHKAKFWEIVQKGLVLAEPLTRKRAMYLLKRTLDLLDKQPCDLLVQSEEGMQLFYWSSDKKDSLMSLWQDYVLLMETLDEKQAHLIKPVLPRISSIVSATKKNMNGEVMLDISWLLTLYQKAAQHDTKFICRWAILDLLNMDLCDSPLLNPCYWWFFYGPLMSMLGECAVYARADEGVRGDPSPVGAAVVAFFPEFAKTLPTDNRQSFCSGLLYAVVQQEFSQVPLVFISQMLATLPPCPAWDSNAMASIRDIFTLFRAFSPHLSNAIQNFLLRAVINLTDPGRVSWSDIGDFLSLLSKDDCLCRGNTLWEATAHWVWQVHGMICQQDSGNTSLSPDKTGFSNLFDYLRDSVEAFLNNETLEFSPSDPEVQSLIRLVIIAYDAHLKFAENSANKQLVEDIFRKIVEVLEHASRHVYASEGRTQRAGMILSGILQHMNSSAAIEHSGGKSDGIPVSTQKIDGSMEIMEKLLRSSGADIFELLLRKLSTVSLNFSQVDNDCAFLDLADELLTFATVPGSSDLSWEVFLQFVENLIQRSRRAVLKKQSDREHLALSDWRSFVLSMKCLAWCCVALRTKPGLYTTHVAFTLSQTVAELDLSSEFPKPKSLYPGEVRGESSAETSRFVKKGWGRLVSDFIEAQWQCVQFLLEETQGYSGGKGRELGEKFEPFLAELPDAALEALSLGSGLAVLPIIRCVRLLTPRMLLTNDSLCSQALEAVWWTFQDRQKRDRVWFWGTLREMTKVFFNPCLLILAEDHPVTATVRKYWGELLALGEDRPGVVNLVIGPCCEFWAGYPCDHFSGNLARQISEENRKQSLEVHLDFITEACIFGPREKKTERVTNYVLECVRRLGVERVISPLNTDELRDDTRVRINAINLLMTLNPKNKRDAKILQRVVQTLIIKHGELSKNKPRSFLNSYSHRRKHRVWQAILVVLSRFFQADVVDEMFAGQVLEEIFRAILCENQVSVRNFLQWGMVLILGKYPSLQPLLWEQLMYDEDRRAGCVSSLIIVAALTGEFSFPDSRSQAAYFQLAFPAILPWVLTAHVMVQNYAQVALQKMWLTCQRQNLHDVISDHAIIQSCVHFLEANNEGLRQKVRVLGDFFFLDIHPYRDFSVQTLFETLPRLAEVTDEEWISPKVFTEGWLGMRVWRSSEDGFRGLPLYNPDDTRVAQISNGPCFTYGENIGEQIRRRLTGERTNEQNAAQTSDTVTASELQSGDVQKKIVPWKVIPPDEEMLSEMQQQRMANLQKSSAGSLIVVASLIDKAPNLGGLCRTCEIFGVQTLVLSNSHVIEDMQFKSLSVSAAKWMNLDEVHESELKSYLARMRHEGYTLVGVEQTANSQNLTRYQFPHKSLLLLGNEREGIPVELIQMLDVCVEIPQVGIIRSLNVHVSGALLVWEYTRQRVLDGSS